MMIYQKSEILKLLVEKKASSYLIPEFFDLYYFDFVGNDYHPKINKKFSDKKIVIRSSSDDEDGVDCSNAGKYESILNVDSCNKYELESAIKSVFHSYDKLFDNSRVIIQEMIVSPSISGVVFTHELGTNAPYYTINYDDISRRTDSVTSGTSVYSNRSLYVLRNKINEAKSTRFKKLLFAVREIEKILNNEFLDIEFAIDRNEQVYIFQVRPLTKISKDKIDISKIDEQLINAKIITLNSKNLNSNLCGSSTILGHMPDWNPAEIIGTSPNILSYDLYSYLVTNKSWATARFYMGYKNLEDYRLMTMLCGKPFIDTRISFNSFLTSDLNFELGEKLVNIWLQKLRENPTLHDKVEFEIAITCYDFSLSQRLNSEEYNSLNSLEKDEIINSYRCHLNSVLNNDFSGGIDHAYKKLDSLIEFQESFGNLANELDEIEFICAKTIEFGIIPFAILARHAFIAKSLLKSLILIGIISEEDYDSIMNSIPTISSSFLDDLHKFKMNPTLEEEFIRNYGHLRPGTYDLMSIPYREMIDKFKESTISCHKNSSFQFSDNQLIKLELLFKECKIDFSSDSLLQYVRRAIQGREYAKFLFTKSIDKVLEIIKEFSVVNNISLSKIINTPLELIMSKNKFDNIQEFIAEIFNSSSNNIELKKINDYIKLPSLVFDDSDFGIIPFMVNEPNFVTSKIVSGSIVELKPINNSSQDIDGKIVVIEGADPGYDWIFSYNIIGLVTKFGGANSHMTIRCHEFEIPAAIGCGEILFNKVLNSSIVELDCKNKKIIV